MLAQVKHVLVCSVGIIYSCGGLLLSILATGFNAALILLALDLPTLPPHEQPPLHRKRCTSAPRARKPSSPSCRDTATSTSSSSSPLTPYISSSQPHSPVGPLVATPPEISKSQQTGCDYFSTRPRRKSLLQNFHHKSRRSSLGDVTTLSSAASISSHESPQCHSADERTSPFKETLKRIRSKSISRCQLLSLSKEPKEAGSLPTPPSPTLMSSPFTLVKSATVLNSKTFCQKLPKRKALRKTPSAPSGQLPTLKVWPASPTLKTKRSQPLRTQPYEAPYFFPMPTVESPSPLPPLPPLPPTYTRFRKSSKAGSSRPAR